MCFCNNGLIEQGEHLLFAAVKNQPPPNVGSDNDFGSGVRTLPFSSYHTFQLLFHINYSSNESGAAFIKLSGGKVIYKAAAR